MAFNYVPSSSPGIGQGLNYGQGLRIQGAQVSQPEIDYGQPYQSQQQQQSIDPMQMYQMYQKFAGSGASSSGSGSGLSGLLSTGGGSAGLGGSGLIGSAGGATSAASTGGASFGLGGSLVGGSGAVGGSTFAAGAGTGAAAGGAGAGIGAGGAAAGGSAAAGGGAAAGGMGGAMAAGGPWALLAAVIMANEEDSRKKGLRAEDRKERTWDQLNGKVLTQDIEGKWGPMQDKWTGGKASKWGLVGDQKGASQIMSLRIGPGLKTLWKEGTLSKIF